MTSHDPAAPAVLSPSVRARRAADERRIGRLPGDVLALRPEGFLWLGILGVLSTPALRVGRALLGFGRRGERRMVAISLLVLAVIAVGVFVGVTAH